MAVNIYGHSEEDLMRMDPEALRAILHERIHHTIEVLIYRILNGKMQKPPNLGNQAKTVMDIWRRRSLPTDSPDIKWCARYLELAEKLNNGEKISIGTKPPEPFSNAEMKAVEKLLYERRSIRQFKDRPVSNDMVRKILQAGLMAPQGCNIGSTRFIVLRNPEEWKFVRSDIPIEHGVMILVCQDMRTYNAVEFMKRVPQNIYYDAAAAADHMCLMAHAMGLGACWLTHGEDTQKRIRERFGLPEAFVTRCHIIVGWPDEAPIKSLRMSLDDVAVAEK